jgi:hypothetical protein
MSRPRSKHINRFSIDPHASIGKVLSNLDPLAEEVLAQRRDDAREQRAIERELGLGDRAEWDRYFSLGDE